MADHHCRVSVVGERRRVDLAVPATAPIAEYVGMLAELCWVEDEDVLPAVWSLAPQDGPVLPPTTSLAAAGVVDGQVLYLRDAAAGEYDEPVVLDLAEMVAEATEQVGGARWDAATRPLTVLAGGVLWLAAVPLLAAFLGAPSRALPGGLALATGLLLPMFAWGARRGRWPAGQAAQQVLALAAVPGFAAAAWFLVPASAPAGLGVVGVPIGALLGGLFALALVPGVAVLAVEVVVLAAVLSTALLVWLSADLTEVAAVLGLVAYALLALAPWLAGHLVSFLAGPEHEQQDDAESATRADVQRGRRLLTVLDVAMTALVGVALVVLAVSDDPFALGLAGCLCVALLWRADGFVFLVEAASAVGAGCVGVVAVLTRLPAVWPSLPPSFGLTVSWLLGSLVLLVGVTLLFRRTQEQPVVRQAWPRVLATLCLVAAIPLTLGVYGVFDQLFALGRTL